MKTIKLKYISRNIFLVLPVLFFTSILQSFTKKNVSTNSPVEPSAKRDAKLKEIKNYNFNKSLECFKVSKKLTQPKEVYFTWLDTEQKVIRNFSWLKTLGSLLFKTFISSMETMDSLKQVNKFNNAALI